MQRDYSTIDLRDLPDEIQEQIDKYPEHSVFFVRRLEQGQGGYELHAVEQRQYESLQGQGGMGAGWIRVRMLKEEFLEDMASPEQSSGEA